MRYQWFHAWEPVDDEVVADSDRFARFLEATIACRFPENGIEWFSPARETRGKNLADFIGFPLDHCAVYAHPGRCEGDMLRVALVTRDGAYIPIVSSKVLASLDEVWSLTRAIAEVTNAVFLYEEQPMLPRLAAPFVDLHQGPFLLDRPRDKKVYIQGASDQGLMVSMEGGPTVRHGSSDAPWYLFDSMTREYRSFFQDIGCSPV